MDASDKLIWSLDPSGCFTTKSAYQSLADTITKKSTWIKSIWKINVQPKIQTFIWLAVQNRILGNENRKKRKLTGDASCKKCGAPVESVIHILRDCIEAKNIWDIMMVDDKFAPCVNLSLEEWVKFNLIDCKDFMVGDWNWKSLFANICWQIWKWRNDWVFSNKGIPLAKKLEIIGKIMNEWKKEWMVKGDGKKKSVVELAWEKPKVNWLKLNIDGSWDQVKNRAAAAGVFRDSLGNWINGFGVNLGNCSIDLAELWGLYHGIRYARQLDLNYIEIESDSKNSIQAIKKGVEKHHPLQPLVQAIRNMLDESWTWTLNYIPREKNMVADWLAKWSCYQEVGVKVLSQPPKGMGNTLLANRIGISHPRLLNM